MSGRGAAAGTSLARALAWITAPPTQALSELPPLASWDRHLRRILPYVFALSTGFQLTKFIGAPGWIAFDAHLYTDAARAWLSGGDPWAVSRLGIPFGAPPPTLLVFAPFTQLPDQLVGAIWIVGSFVFAAMAIRALRMPLWWITFWPIVDGALVGNPDVAVLAMLVILGQRLDVLAPVLKVYAVLPLVAERRWRSLGAFTAVALVSALVLPWAAWVGALPSIAESLRLHAGTTSVWGEAVLMSIGVVALASMGVRRAAWLAVPVLWPWTQAHYMAMSVPALTPFLAIAWSVPQPPPILILGSIVIAAIGARLFPGPQSVAASDSDDPGPSRLAADQSDFQAVTLSPQEDS